MSSNKEEEEKQGECSQQSVAKRDPNEPMKITDLEVVFLEDILEYLSLDDLLNVSHVDEKLKKAATFVYYQSYENHLSIKCSRQKNAPTATVFRNAKREELLDLPSILNLIEFFGRAIFAISFDWTYPGLPDSVFDTITEHCKVNLQSFIFEVEYNDLKSGMLDKFNQPLATVKYVEFAAKTIIGKADSLDRVFPNMERLKLNGNHDFYRKNVDRHFPNLKELHIVGAKSTPSFNELFARMLNLNQQLTTLKLFPYTFYSTLQNANLDNLKSLTLHLSPCEPYKDYTNETLNLLNVTEFSLSIGECADKNGQPISIEKIPFSFDKLEIFNLNMINMKDVKASVVLREYFYDFISNHNKIKKFGGIFNANEIDKNRLVQYLPLVECIYFKGYSYENDMVNAYMPLFKSLNMLKTFEFFMKKSEYSGLLEKYCYDWSVLRDKKRSCRAYGYYVTMERYARQRPSGET